MKSATLYLALTLAATMAQADTVPPTKLLDIQSYAPQADLSGLSFREATQIHAIIQTGRSPGLIRNLVRGQLRKAGIDPRGS